MKVEISAGILLLLAALLLLLPLQWVGAAILAAMIHELFHLLAVKLVGGKVGKIQLGGRGAVMSAATMSAKQVLFCTIAGPIGSISLLFLARWMPRTAVCGMLQGLYNLLPLLPLDGGHILRTIVLAIFPPHKAERIFLYIQKGFYLLLGILVVILVLRVGAIILIPLFFLLPRILFGGTIGKETKKRYRYDRDIKTHPAHGAEACPLYRR